MSTFYEYLFTWILSEIPSWLSERGWRFAKHWSSGLVQLKSRTHHPGVFFQERVFCNRVSISVVRVGISIYVRFCFASLVRSSFFNICCSSQGLQWWKQKKVKRRRIFSMLIFKLTKLTTWLTAENREVVSISQPWKYSWFYWFIGRR